jgi:peptidoglycan/LPS O-acetylase OafA/YrhL
MQNWEDYQLYSIFRRLPVFACGGVAYFIVKDMPSAWKNSTNAALCMAAAAVIFFAEAQQKEAFLDVYTWRGVMFAFVIVGLGCFQFSLVVNRFLQFIGRISYSLYLLHIPVILFLIPLYRWIEARAVPSASFCLCVAVTWIAAVLLAWFVHTVYEAPMNSFGRSLAKRVGRVRRLADNSAAA